MSALGYTELGESWGPWYGAHFEDVDSSCARLRDLSIAALKLWSSFSAKSLDSSHPNAKTAKDRACHLMVYYASRWAARRRHIAESTELLEKKAA